MKPMKLTPKAQKHAILSILNRGWSITPIEALAKFSCLRLAARIHEIRQDGYAKEKNNA